MSGSVPLDLLVVQATPFCNIDCTYCYLPGRSRAERMSDMTLGRLFDWVFALPLSSDRFTVVWHAGEPLVPGVEYYRRAFAAIERRRPASIAVEHSFQTNALLISPAWVEFFREIRPSLGVSLDGPADLHDLHRRTRRGAGTFDAAMRGVQLLREGRVPFHVICVLTRRSLSRADELFAFFRELEVDWIGFNFDEAEGEHTASSMAYPDCAAEVRGFFDRFLTLNAEAGHPISVREFEGVVQGILTVDAPDPTNQQADPFRIISVDVDGNISTFSPELLGFSHPRYGTFSFGNIWTDTIEDIRRSPRYQAVAGDIARGVTSCRETCDYYSVCLGGAPANKLFENGCFDTTETLYCRLSKQAPVDVVLASLERAFRPSAARRAMAEV